MQRADVIRDDCPSRSSHRLLQEPSSQHSEGVSPDARLEEYIAEHFPTLRDEMRFQAARDRRLGSDPTTTSVKSLQRLKETTSEMSGLLLDGGARRDNNTNKAPKRKRGRPKKSAGGSAAAEPVTDEQYTSHKDELKRKRGRSKKDRTSSEAKHKQHRPKMSKKTVPEQVSRPPPVKHSGDTHACEKPSKSKRSMRVKTHSAANGVEDTIPLRRSSRTRRRTVMSTRPSKFIMNHTTTGRRREYVHISTFIQNAERSAVFAILKVGTHHIVCLHDTGTAVTQFSTKTIDRLQRKNVRMTKLESTRVMWKTASGVQPVVITV